jgi:hypothetical protein
MNAKLIKLFQELDKYKNFPTIEDELRFLEFFNHIIKIQDTESISRLLDYIDDDLLKEDYINEELPRCLIFGFSSRNFIPAFLKKVPSLLKKSPDICVDLCQSIFDDEVDINKDSLEIFKKHLHISDKASVKALLDKIGENNRHQAIFQELRKELKEE